MWTAIIITAMILGFAGSVLLLVNKWIKHDHETEKLKLTKEIAELEIKQMEMKMNLLEKENKKYDDIIDGR